MSNIESTISFAYCLQRFVVVVDDVDDICYSFSAKCVWYVEVNMTLPIFLKYGNNEITKTPKSKPENRLSFMSIECALRRESAAIEEEQSLLELSMLIKFSSDRLAHRLMKKKKRKKEPIGTTTTATKNKKRARA